MPTILHESVATESGDLQLLHPDTGDLTIEAQVMADFLTHVDLSPVSEVEGIEGACFEAPVENDEGVAEKTRLIPGEVVATLVDEDDLGAMFVHYLNQRAQQAFDSDTGTLESKAQLAPFAELLDEKYTKGAFRRMHKKPAGHNKAARQLTAMLMKGVIKHVTKGKGQGFNKDYVRDRGYKSGGTPQGRKRVDLFKGKSKAKLRKAAVKAKVKVKEDAGFEEESTPMWGLGLPHEGASYVASLRADAAEILAERKKRGGKGLKGAGKPAMPHPPMDSCESEEDRTKGAVYSVNEGAGLAGKMLALTENRTAAGQPTPDKK